ncbi:MAG: ssl1498 family light-harvesting-like protein [Cyanobacteria bacterium MAG CAR3_bin_5]|nr:ssl1498 family light-harvesting-like protein [Cyanobacteria bacterium MAG CAR3_bin_5]MCY4333010.1 ssl1498 family light-harvesting-like protein [Cyanobacteria bacterium MAG CAR1_bin_15]
MTVTHEDGGRLNAFAREPKMVIAEPLTGAEQRQRLWLYGLGAGLVAVMVAVTTWVSRGLV